MSLCNIYGALVCLLMQTFISPMLGPISHYIAILLMGGNVGFFMWKSLQIALEETSGFTPGFVSDGLGSPGREKRKRKFSLLAGVGVLQPLFCWYLSRV